MKAYKKYFADPPHVWIPALLVTYVSFFFFRGRLPLLAWFMPGLFFALMLTGTLADLFGQDNSVKRASVQLVVLLALLSPILLAVWMSR